MANYTLAHSKGQAFLPRERASEVLREMALFIESLEAGDEGLMLAILAVDISYNDEGDPYGSVFYEQV